MEHELKKIYDSEINIEISCFWDSGWQVRIGDSINGYKYPDWDCCELDEVIPALQELIKKHYPESEYAKSLPSQNEI